MGVWEGWCTSFEEAGATNCYVGEVAAGQTLRAVFDAISDGSLEWASLGAVYDRIVIGADSYELRAGAENLRCDLKRYFPREAPAIDRYFTLVSEVLGVGAIAPRRTGRS
jgi:all-trans-retinol 13,14-reductase